MRVSFTSILLLLSFYFFTQNIIGQTSTAGSGTLATIESKANSIQDNKKKITDLETKVTDSYAEESARLLQLKKQLPELLAEKAVVLDELRSGMFCSDCNRGKTQVERETGNFYAHIREGASSGRKIIAASPELIQQKTGEYDKKIAAKEEEIRKFTYEENEFSKKRDQWKKQVEDLKAQSIKLCEEITALSSTYKTQVVDEGKALQSPWISDLMNIVAEKHFIEDRIDILNVKIADLNNDEIKAVADMRDKVYQKNEADKSTLNSKIASNNSRLATVEQAHRQSMMPLTVALLNARTRLLDIKRALLNTTSLSKGEITKLESDQKTEELNIDNKQIQVANNEASYKINSQAIVDENKKLSDDIWNLTVNYPKILAAAEDNLKKAFQTKRTILTDAKVARTAALDLKGSMLIDRKEAYRQKLLKYAAIVDGERIRLLNACQKAQCSCFGADTHGTVISNWNQASGCVGEMDAAHHSSDPVYGCVEESSIYKQHYQSFINGLSDSDIEALQRKSTNTRYDMIFKKVIN